MSDEELEKEYKEIKDEVYPDGEKNTVALLVNQGYINAAQIEAYEEMDENSFPWHGHSLQDFEELNNELIKAIPIFQNCKTDSEVNKAIRKYPEVFEAYYSRVILCEKKEDGRIELADDGRHRLYVAKKKGNNLPVIIFERVDVNDVDLETFKRRYVNLSWRF